MNFALAGVISAVIQLFVFLVIARAIGSFFVRDWSRGIPRFLWDVTEPVLAPVRRILPPFGGLDFSPLVVIVLLQLANSFLRGAGV
jgi:YggT family protein